MTGLVRGQETAGQSPALSGRSSGVCGFIQSACYIRKLTSYQYSLKLKAHKR